MKRTHWLLLGMFLAACGKDAPSSPPPELSAPGKVLAGKSGASSPDTVAQAEVKASSGPVELTFRLHKTTIRLGESLWHQLRLRNLGGEEMLVGDQIFIDPWLLRDNIWAEYGIFIEVVGPDGAALKPPVGRDGVDSGIADGVSGMLEINGPEEQAMVDGWRKQGLSEYQVQAKLVEFNMSKARRNEAQAERPAIWLKPGESVETKSWFHHSKYDQFFKKKPAPRPIGNFSELEFYDLEKPGRYKVRAIYKLKPPLEIQKDYKRMRLGIPAELVNFETAWIQVTVTP